MHDPEHSFEYLEFADANSGERLEFLEQPENYWTKGEGYRGEILVCADGKRIIQRTYDVCGWFWRHRTAKGWREGPVIPTRLEEDNLSRKGWVRASRSTSMVVSADGGTVVISGVLNGERVIKPSKRYRPVEVINAERYVREFEAEVWSIDKRGKVTPQVGIPPVALPYRSDHDPVVAVSSGKKPLIAVCADGRVTVHARSGEQVVALELPAPPKPTRTSRQARSTHRAPKPSLRFSDDGQRLLGHFGSVVHAWDTVTWKQATIRLATTASILVAVSPNGESIAVAGEGGVVRFFDAATGAPGTVMTPPLTPAHPKSKDATPVALCFSSDGLMCLLGLANGSIAIWDVD